MKVWDYVSIIPVIESIVGFLVEESFTMMAV